MLGPAGAITFGWTLYKGVMFMAPEIGTLFFGVGYSICLTAINTYLIDIVPGKSGSGMAVSNFVRFTLSAVGIVLTRPLVIHLGEGVVGSICGGICVLSISSLLAVVKVFNLSGSFR
jgi:hypothetical protein